MGKAKIRTLIPILIIIYILISELFMYQITFLNYTDEIVTVFFAIYLLYLVISKKTSIFSNKIIILLLFTLIIGVIGNYFSKSQSSINAIVLDIVSNYKLFICSIGFYYLLTVDSIKKITYYFSRIGRLYIFLGFIFSLASLFVNLGMRGQFRYGIWGFNYIFKYAHVYAMVTFFFLLNVCNGYEKKSLILRNVFYVAIQLSLSLKGPAIIVSILFFVMIFYHKYAKNLKILLVILVLLLILTIGQYQINSYILNTNAPRYVLTKYAVIVANKYFGIGSGFATFGTEMSARYYSIQYYEFGFTNMYGLNPLDTQFINDNYFQSILGQFGWIGLCLFLIIFIMYFNKIRKLKLNLYTRSILLSIIFYTFICSFGSSHITSSTCILLIFSQISTIKISERKLKLNYEKQNCKSYLKPRSI